MTRREHWNEVHDRREPTELTWYQPRLSISLRLVEQAGLPKSAGILDVGGGASTLVDDLLDQGYDDVTVLDCSSTAIDAARSRLGARAVEARWLLDDVTTAQLPASRYDLWHDRAVFHFLTQEDDRAAYRSSFHHGLRPGAYLIVSTFALTGPERCSRLPVMRYDVETLQGALGPGLRLLATIEEAHPTPSGNRQDFLYCLFRRS